MAVYTTLAQTKEIAQGAAQGALDLVAEQDYAKKTEIDSELEVITTDLSKKVEVEVIKNNLIFK